jgi:hypothetical protein
MKKNNMEKKYCISRQIIQPPPKTFIDSFLNISLEIQIYSEAENVKQKHRIASPRKNQSAETRMSERIRIHIQSLEQGSKKKAHTNTFVSV